MLVAVFVMLDDDCRAAALEDDHLAAVGVAEDLRGQAGGRAEEDLPPLTQSTESKPWAWWMSWVETRIVAPSSRRLAEDLEDALAGGPVDSAERLVEEDHVGLLGEGAGDQHPLSLASGELAELLARAFGEADPLRAPSAARRFARAAERAEAGRARDRCPSGRRRGR